MAKIPSQLQQAAEQIRANDSPRSVGVRKFLSWFGVKRRGHLVVRQIRSSLKRANLVTEPDFEVANIEGRIKLRSLKITSEIKKENATILSTKPAAQPIITQLQTEMVDPTPRLGTLDPANRKPISIKRDASLREAVTLMAKHGFSQLPVMQNNKDVDGLISWKSIGEASILRNRECTSVRESMETDVEILKESTPLWKAIRSIADNDVVLVKNSAGEIIGLVTTHDIAVKYHSLAEPFLLLGEIENNLRQLIACANYPQAVLEAAKDPKDTQRKILGVADLTFGEYIRLLQDRENWRLTGYGLARKTFLEDLEAIRKIRNEVMHFHPDPLTEEQLVALRRIANLLRSLQLWSPNQKRKTQSETKPPMTSSVQPSSNRKKLRIPELIRLGRVKSGDKLTVRGRTSSDAEVIDDQTIRLADGQTMTWNEYGQKFTGHIAVNIYKQVYVNGVLLGKLRSYSS